MDEFLSIVAGTFFIAWVGFSSLFTITAGTSDNITKHTRIIELCKDVGQFQYEKTVVLCEVKKEKTKE